MHFTHRANKFLSVSAMPYEQSLSERRFRRCFSSEKLYVGPICRPLFCLNSFLLTYKPTRCISEKATRLHLLWGATEAFSTGAGWLGQTGVMRAGAGFPLLRGEAPCWKNSHFWQSPALLVNISLGDFFPAFCQDNTFLSSVTPAHRMARSQADIC